MDFPANHVGLPVGINGGFPWNHWSHLGLSLPPTWAVCGCLCPAPAPSHGVVSKDWGISFWAGKSRFRGTLFWNEAWQEHFEWDAPREKHREKRSFWTSVIKLTSQECTNRPMNEEPSFEPVNHISEVAWKNRHADIITTVFSLMAGATSANTLYIRCNRDYHHCKNKTKHEPSPVGLHLSLMLRSPYVVA